MIEEFEFDLVVLLEHRFDMPHMTERINHSLMPPFVSFAGSNNFSSSALLMPVSS